MSAATATDFPDPGMIDHLRELAAAEPFKPFTIHMQSGTELRVERASHITFTAFGTPKVYCDIGVRAFGLELNWHLLNVDAITTITI